MVNGISHTIETSHNLALHWLIYFRIKKTQKFCNLHLQLCCYFRHKTFMHHRYTPQKRLIFPDMWERSKAICKSFDLNLHTHLRQKQKVGFGHIKGWESLIVCQNNEILELVLKPYLYINYEYFWKFITILSSCTTLRSNVIDAAAFGLSDLPTWSHNLPDNWQKLFRA